MTLGKRVVTRKPTADIAPFGLRMQQDLKAELERAAENEGRSLNAEIVLRLQRSFANELFGLSADAADAVRNLCQSRGMDFGDAVSALIVAGASSSRTMLYANIGQGATVGDFKRVFCEGAAPASDDSPVYVGAKKPNPQR